MKQFAIRTLLTETIAEIEQRKNNGGISGIPTGFHVLDQLTGGWRKGELIIIGGRPSIGKTTLALCMARNIAVNHGIGVGFFSVQESSAQLTIRLISREVNIVTDKLRKGILTDKEIQRIHERITQLSQAPIFIDSAATLTELDFRAKCFEFHDKHNVQLFIIDDLEEMLTRFHFKYEEERISYLLGFIKQTAKELGITIIVLSQISRSAEKQKGDKRPILSDLLGYRNADSVMFLCPPEYYDFSENETGNSNENEAELIVAKNRNGYFDSILLNFIGKYARFEEPLYWEDYIQEIEENEFKRVDDEPF